MPRAHCQRSMSMTDCQGSVCDKIFMSHTCSLNNSAFWRRECFGAFSCHLALILCRGMHTIWASSTNCKWHPGWRWRARSWMASSWVHQRGPLSDWWTFRLRSEQTWWPYHASLFQEAYYYHDGKLKCLWWGSTCGKTPTAVYRKSSYVIERKIMILC